jgi:hypothetical protein
MTVLHENTIPEDRKGLRREASKLSAIRYDTETNEELLGLVIFGCKVLPAPSLYPSKRRWLDAEIRLLRELQEDGGPRSIRKDFLDALKMMIMLHYFEQRSSNLQIS